MNFCKLFVRLDPSFGAAATFCFQCSQKEFQKAKQDPKSNRSTQRIFTLTTSSTMAPIDYEGMKILITGGGSGMGLEMAKSFAKDGATVIITGRHKDKLDEAAKQHENIVPYVCDVASDNDMIKLRNAMEKEYNGIDFLINNAGVLHMFDIKDASYDINKEFQEVNIDINGVIRGVHYFLPMLLKKEKAMIMNVSSAIAYMPMADAPVYSATKAFVHSYTQSLRVKLKDDKNITVFELLPPMVDTPMTTDFTFEKTKGFTKMPVDEFVAAVRNGIDNGQEEITPGDARMMYWMSRLAPTFLFNQING